MIKKLIQNFDNWEKESLAILREQDLEILLINFVDDFNQQDFLHNLADMMFRLNETLKTPHNNRKIQSAIGCYCEKHDNIYDNKLSCRFCNEIKAD